MNVALATTTRKILPSIVLPTVGVILASNYHQQYHKLDDDKKTFCDAAAANTTTNDNNNGGTSDGELLRKKKGVSIQKRVSLYECLTRCFCIEHYLCMYIILIIFTSSFIHHTCSCICICICICTSTPLKMTQIGRFSLKTETNVNPSVPTFFIALSSPSPSSSSSSSSSITSDVVLNVGAINHNNEMTVTEFINTWYKRNMPNLHPRFHYKLSSSRDGHFEPISTNGTTNYEGEDEDKDTTSSSSISTKGICNLDKMMMMKHHHVTETLPMSVYRLDLKKRIENLISTSMDVKNRLWLVQISSGELGSSGAISKQRVEQIKQERSNEQQGEQPTIKESVLLFKCHHCMGDAVSFVTAISDLIDEADEIKELIRNEIQKRKMKLKEMKWWKKLLRAIQKVLWFLFGSMEAIMKHVYLLATTKKNPFLIALGEESSEKLVGNGRSISWCDVAPVDEVKLVAKKVGSDSTTINDIFVSCVSAAIARQLSEHQQNNAQSTALRRPTSKDEEILPKMNVVIPAHLNGGILPPGKSISNLIGAFVAQVPCQMDKASFASDRLVQVHNSLDRAKRSPAPFVSYYIAKFTARWAPERLAVRLFNGSSANAAVAITNSRTLFKKKVHINGRRIEATGGFLPLPPNIPVGVAISSYGSVITLSINT